MMALTHSACRGISTLRCACGAPHLTVGLLMVDVLVMVQRPHRPQWDIITLRIVASRAGGRLRCPTVMILVQVPRSAVGAAPCTIVDRLPIRVAAHRHPRWQGGIAIAIAVKRG